MAVYLCVEETLNIKEVSVRVEPSLQQLLILGKQGIHAFFGKPYPSFHPTMFSLSLYLKDPAGTQACGEALGRFCQLPLIMGLNGELGAGKTALSQGIGRGFGISEHLTSPSFALVHEYTGPRGKLYHLDVYRLDHFDEVLDLDFESMISDPHSLVLIEWKNKFSDWPAGPDCLELELRHRPQGRTLELSAPDRQIALREPLQTWVV